MAKNENQVETNTRVHKFIYFSFQNSFDVADILLSLNKAPPHLLLTSCQSQETPKWHGAIANETPFQHTFFLNRSSRLLRIFCYIAESNSIDKVSIRDNRWYESYCCWWKKLNDYIRSINKILANETIPWCHELLVNSYSQNSLRDYFILLYKRKDMRLRL